MKRAVASFVCLLLASFACETAAGSDIERGDLSFSGEKIHFQTKNGTVTFSYNNAPGLNFIKYTKKVHAKDGKDTDISEITFESGPNKMRLIQGIPLPVIRISDGDKITWRPDEN